MSATPSIDASALVVSSAHASQPPADAKNLGTISYRSMLNDMYDDMAALLSTFADRRQARMTATEQIALRSALPIIEPGAITKVQMLRELLQNTRHASAERWMSMAYEIFPDASDLALALAELRRAANLTEADRKRVDDAYHALLESEGQQKIRAGINAAHSAKLYGERLNVSPGTLRQTYRILIMTQLSAHAMYEYLIETFGFENRRYVIDFFEAALACDVRSTDPSCTKQEFSQLWNMLYQLRLLRAADFVFLAKARRGHKKNSAGRKLERRASFQRGQSNANHDEGSEDEHLILLLLAAIRDIDATSIADCVADVCRALLGAPSLDDLAAFVQRIFLAFAAMPPDLFASLEQRNAILSALGKPLELANFPRGVIGCHGIMHA